MHADQLYVDPLYFQSEARSDRLLKEIFDGQPLKRCLWLIRVSLAQILSGELVCDAGHSNQGKGEVRS
jgi:hypothetical protein